MHFYLYVIKTLLISLLIFFLLIFAQFVFSSRSGTRFCCSISKECLARTFCTDFVLFFVCVCAEERKDIVVNHCQGIYKPTTSV